MSHEDIACLKYASIVSSVVERSCSKFKPMPRQPHKFSVW